MAVIGVYLSSAIGTGRRVWELRDRIEDASAVAGICEFLRRQIEQAWLAFERTEAGDQRLVFSGMRDRIEFVSPISDGTNWGGLYRIVISEKSNGTSIHIAGDLFRTTGARTVAAFDRDLLDFIQGLSFSYFGSTSPDEKSDWHDNWSSNKGLPQLVRMKVDIAAGSKISWPDLIVGLASRNPENPSLTRQQ